MQKTKAFQRIYTKLSNITRATCSLRVEGVGYEELAWVDGRPAQVIRAVDDMVTLQVFPGTAGISTTAEVVFSGHPPTLNVSELLCGRFLNAYGEPIDGGPEVEGETRPIGGATVNPVRRKKPSQLLATGIAGIDLNNTLVTGQKIPFFTDPGQPYNYILAQVAMRAKADRIILGGMGLLFDDYLFFKNTIVILSQYGIQIGIITKICIFFTHFFT